MKSIQKGFTLIELMIVVAIIGILAAVAIPAYQDYIGRAQVSEAVNLLGSGKTPMAEFFASNGAWPTGADAVMGNTTGKYTKSITLQGASGTTNNVTIVATMQSSGINSNLFNSTVGLNTTDGGKVWTCFTSNTGASILPKYVPSNCRS
jgi:type IV pilus assembly protein PilA